MKKLFLLAAVLSSALALTACGGGGGGEVVQAAATDVALPINAQTGVTTTTAVLSKEFDFPKGVPDFGTTTTTTVTFVPRTSVGVPDTTAPGNPGFTITAANTGTATGVMEFGSCRFRIITSTFPAGHAMSVGNLITVSRCEINLDIDGLPADTVSRTRSATLLLNAAASSGEPVTVNINTGGQITLNAVSIGTVTLVVVSGG